MNKHCIKAFTIMETTIAMLIASIVIAITYTVYTIVSKSYQVYNEKNSNMSALIRLDELLKADFDDAGKIVKEQNGIMFLNDEKLITYKIEPGFIVRTNIITDTFKVNIQQVNTLFENEPVNGEEEESERNRIDELQLILLFENKKIPYYYHKQYSSVNLIQRNKYAIN